MDRNDFYLYIGSDRSIRRQSSSGGAFTAFASEVLDAGGIVYASRYDFSREQLEVSDTDHYPLDEFRKSKYLESNTLHSFSKIKDHLSQGRRVLFCGTPCQVAGLKTFIGEKEEPLLFTIDFFCHGVPSNEHFKQYKHFLEGSKRRMTAFDFRYKQPGGDGWHDLLFKADFDDGSSILHPYRAPHHFLYYRPFEESLFLRRSCYGCRRVGYSKADVTVGDFWGIGRSAFARLDDNGGVSVVKLHSRRAKDLWQHIAATGIVHEIPYESVARNYTHAYPASFLQRRNRLAGRIVRKGYLSTMRNYYRIERMWYEIKRIVKFLIGKSE